MPETETKTPICDFVAAYEKRGGVRAHMPAHKGAAMLGCEKIDITEVSGADELYFARGIIAQSERIAGRAFSSGATYYSTEGSSLVIRAMAYLALMNAKNAGSASKTVLAGRNAHRTLISAAALLDLDIEWLYPKSGDGVLECDIGADELACALDALDEKPIAVYVTSPDYLGNIADIGALSKVTKPRGVPLIVDNAHGAYLAFLEGKKHPIALGADMCADSAHKTLPCLTGSAYLHIAKDAPKTFFDLAENALALFASTSPSYLILQSLDGANALLLGGYREKLAIAAGCADELKAALKAHGYTLVGNEKLKLTIAPKRFGYTGNELADALRKSNIECEFSDRDHIVLMLSAENGADDFKRIKNALLAIEKRPPIDEKPPRLTKPDRRLSVREAVLSVSERIKTIEAEGRTVALDHFGCPPAVPIAVPGEALDKTAVEALIYYGYDECSVLKE